MQPFVSAVNQKKVYAELLLRQAGEAAGQRHLQQALLQGSAMHLEHAYRYYLAEIGASYQCREPARLTDLWTLIANLQLQGQNPAETKELHNLEGEEDSWLARLLACCDALSFPPEAAGPPVADPNRIPAFSTDRGEDWSNLSCERVKGWLDAFEEMLERHRQSMVEW